MTICRSTPSKVVDIELNALLHFCTSALLRGVVCHRPYIKSGMVGAAQQSSRLGLVLGSGLDRNPWGLVGHFCV
jgi:hypothetical protein